MLGFEISEIRSVDVMTSLGPLEWCKMPYFKACSGYSSVIRYIRESVFKSQVDPGATAMEPVLPQRLKAQCMDA